MGSTETTSCVVRTDSHVCEEMNFCFFVYLSRCIVSYVEVSCPKNFDEQKFFFHYFVVSTRQKSKFKNSQTFCSPPLLLSVCLSSSSSSLCCDFLRRMNERMDGGRTASSHEREREREREEFTSC
jgi:hypothetical protein